MIFTTIEQCRRYACLGANFQKAFDWLHTVSLDTIPSGKHEIDGENVYASVAQCALRKRAGDCWEAHHLYADVHLILAGQERIGYFPAEKMTAAAPYDRQKDTQLLEDKAGNNMDLQPGDLLIFLPQDAHKPGMMVPNGPLFSQKLIIKVRL